VIEQIDDRPAAHAPHADTFVAAGFRRDGMALRSLAPVV
jgi:hypothetical protein